MSLLAMVFAGALLVGMSVPANALMSDVGLLTASGVIERTPGQSLQVSGDVLEASPARDNFEVISYAQVLALKYSGVDYSYAVTSGAVRWPFPYSVPITDGFGERIGGFHKGVDFVPGGGTPIYAIADGVATTAVYDNSGYGQHVVILHDLAGVKIESLYAHMIEGSSPIVVGQPIKVGDFLGLVGDTGVAYGAHLHFEVHVNGVPVDPFAWLQANAVN
jgi:murein DD-endopeptidase MepM/ murein hydrolase activator NlpD